MDYFTSFQNSNLIKLIDSTRKELFLSLPSLHIEVKDAVNTLVTNSDVSVHILVDFDAQTIRQGYGNLSSITELVTENIDIRTLNDNRIAFIISDDQGYYLFIESRSLIPADKVTINAVKIDPVSMVRLKHFFFEESTQNSMDDEMSNAIIEESKQLKESKSLLSAYTAEVRKISGGQIQRVSDDLTKNPPLNPDYKRLVEFYSARFQYVKLTFKGANISSRKIEIPKGALPINNADLKNRLETKINLFSQKDREDVFKQLYDSKTKVEELRKEYLKKVKSRDESLLKKTDKEKFENALKSLSEEITKIKSQIIVNLDKQINSTKESLMSDLIKFFIDNPKELFPGREDIWEKDEYIKSQARTVAEFIVNRIKWPKPHLMVDTFELVTNYSDITYENLKDKDFIKELKEIGLIKAEDERYLADFGKGIGVTS